MFSKLGEPINAANGNVFVFSGKTPGVFDHIIINDDVEIAYNELRNVVIKVCLLCGDFCNHSFN